MGELIKPSNMEVNPSTAEYDRLDREGIASWTQINRENPMLSQWTIPQRINLGDVMPMPDFCPKTGDLKDITLVKTERQNKPTEVRITAPTLNYTIFEQ